MTPPPRRPDAASIPETGDAGSTAAPEAGASGASAGATEDPQPETPGQPSATGPETRIAAARALRGQRPHPAAWDEPTPEAPAEGAPRGPITDALRNAWPAYFGRPPRETAPLYRSLPQARVDLTPFLDTVIPGPEGPTWAGRLRTPIAHFRALEPEFGTRRRIGHLLACVTVILRRDPQNPRARRLFHRITARHGPEAAAAMNLRWLTAVCDSFVDVGSDPLDRALGMTGTLLSNTLKLAETERRMFYPPRAWPPEAALRRVGPMYDGVIGYWVGHGDMIENLIDRVERALQVGSPAAPFLREVLERCFAENTVLRRMLEVQDGRNFPLAPEERLAAARKAMKGL